MLMCYEPVTLVRHIADGNDDRYACIALLGVSWYGKAGMTVDAKGAYPQNGYKCRIPTEQMPTGIEPRKGDWLVRGVLTTVQRVPADLQDRTCFQITSVGDNRRGRFPHWSVSG